MSKICAHIIIVLAVTTVLASAQAVGAAEPKTITNTLGMKLISVPAGEFTMGSEEERSDTLKYFAPYCDPKWLDGELPRHPVRITRPFYMGTYEVTLGDFQKFCDEAKYKTEIERDGKPSARYETTEKPILSSDFRPWAPGFPIEKDHPAVFVSWNDSVEFCKWLSKKEGKSYRLPTEAEWEYACRAGSKSRYSFGDNAQDLVHHANAADQDRKLHCPGCNVMIPTFDANGKKTDKTIPFPFLSGSDGYVWTAPVGKYKPNAFGLHDMHGNGWEWCSDWFDEHYYEKSPVDDPQGPETGAKRVCRGGGYYPVPVFLRCASRGSDPESFRDCCNAFRVVCEE
jgi:formylglycine-generating enzyme required for sulfatase activity